jgi:hypothetical protein
MPTPNWKSATPRTPKAAYDTMRTSWSVPSAGTPKKRNSKAGKSSVGTLKLG